MNTYLLLTPPSPCRQRLPAADITTAVAASQRIALCHTPTLLEHTHGQCSSLVVALLRLDLLQLRLPRTKQAAMRALGALLKEGCVVLGAALACQTCMAAP